MDGTGTPTGPGGGQTYTFTLVKNGADSALTCNYTGATTSCSDAVNTVAFSTLDAFSMHAVSTGGAAGLNVSCAFEFDPS